MTNGKKSNYSIAIVAKLINVKPEQLINVNISTIEELVEKFSTKEKAIDDYNKMIENLGLKETKGE